MLWVKRNLFLVVFGVIALGLLGWSVWYFLGNRAENKKFEEELQAAQTQLEGLYQQKPFPSESNIAMAKADLVRVRQSINTVKQYFTPIPFEKVADKDFTALLQNTIFDLQKRAQQLGIELPEKDYAFSFKAQKNALTFAPGSFPTLPEQLAEIKALSELVFEAKVNRIASIKRMRVTTDDDPARSLDYHEYKTTTNTVTGTVSNPYEFTIHSFSGDLAKVLEGLYKSSHGFIVKSLAVAPVDEAPQVAAAKPGPVVPEPRGVKPPPGGKTKEVLRTIINERLLKATLLIEVIKPIR